MPQIVVIQFVHQGKQAAEFTFWKAFTSTSLNLEQAEKFTEKNVSGIIFEIKLSDINPHPFLELLGDWSKYYKENEVLLWPNFAFRYVRSRKEKWYDYVELDTICYCKF